MGYSQGVIVVYILQTDIYLLTNQNYCWGHFCGTETASSFDERNHTYTNIVRVSPSRGHSGPTTSIYLWELCAVECITSNNHVGDVSIKHLLYCMKHPFILEPVKKIPTI